MVSIFVLAVFLLILSVDMVVLKFQGKNHPAFEPSLPQGELLIFNRSSFAIPSNTFFSKGHTWLKKESEGVINVGIDAFGASALGSLSIFKCAEAGQELKRGEVIFEGSYGNKPIHFLSPVNGIVKSFNTEIIGKKITKPYETWGVQLISNDLSENRSLYFSGSEALKWMNNEFSKLKSFIDVQSPQVELAGVTMYDGGLPNNDIESLLAGNSINDFEKEFLSI